MSTPHPERSDDLTLKVAEEALRGAAWRDTRTNSPLKGQHVIHWHTEVYGEDWPVDRAVALAQTAQAVWWGVDKHHHELFIRSGDGQHVYRFDVRRADYWHLEACRARVERDALKAAILDIDAHATPYGDIPDDPGYVGTYLLTAGALHRALGKIGHSAPKCQAEAVVAGAKALAEQWIGNQDAGTIGDSIRADAGRQILAHLRALGAPCSHRDAS